MGCVHSQIHKCFNFRFGLTIEHVRIISTIGTTLLCGLLAIVDSFTLYRIVSLAVVQ